MRARFARRSPGKCITDKSDLLKTWRGLREGEQQEEADALLPELLMSVNAIASGLHTTGWLKSAAVRH